MTRTSRIGGSNGDVDIGDGKSTNDNVFDPEAFHRLRLQRLENQRRSERLRFGKNGERNQIRWNSNTVSHSVESSMELLKRGGSLHVSQQPFETDADAFKKRSARQELLLLGKRYASAPSSAKHRCTNVESPETLASSSSQASPEHNEPRHRGVGASSAKGSLQHLPPFLSSRSLSAPPGHLSNEKETGASIERCSEEDADFSHYLLLARSTSPMLPASKGENGDGNDVDVDPDDESSAASYNTPAPHLQAASACNSHGENEDGCEERKDLEVENHHFSSFCRAQMLISEIEEGASGKLPSETGSMKGDGISCAWTQTFIPLGTRSALAFIAGSAVWYYMTSWRWSTRSSMESFSSWQLPLSNTPEIDYMASRLKIASTVKRMLPTTQCHFASSLMIWANIARGSATDIYAEWTKEFDVLSWMVETLFRLEKAYYDATKLFGVVHDTSVAACNATLSVAIFCWHQMEAVSPTHLFHKSKELILIRKATLTAPILWSLNDTSENETLIPSTAADSEVRAHESSPPRAWKKATFVRNELPSIRQNFHRYIHTIPALGSDSTVQWRISAYPHIKEQSSHALPIIGLDGSHLSLGSFRLDSTSISPDIHKNIAVSMIMLRSRPPPIYEGHQVAVTKERNYYRSSYPTHGKSHGKDVFDDVDVLDMAREYIGKILKKRRRGLDVESY